MIVLIVLAVRRAGQARREKDPLEILEERLARGEISTDEFERLKRRLSDRE